VNNGFTSWVSLQDARPVCEIQDKRTISVVDRYTLLLGTVYVSDATVYFCDYTYEDNGIPWTVRRSVNVSVIRKYGRTVAAGCLPTHTHTHTTHPYSQHTPIHTPHTHTHTHTHTTQDEHTPIHTTHKMNTHPYTHHTPIHTPHKMNTHPYTHHTR
jgi:hypothetical protein